MNIRFVSCEYKDIEQYLKEYIEELASPIDSYMEQQILESKYYCITLDNIGIGCIAIKKGSELTLFYVNKEVRHLSQDIYMMVRRMENIQLAIVATADEFHFAHAIDNYDSIAKQAYFFQDREDKESIEYNNEIYFRLATIDDKEKILTDSDDFFEDIDKYIDLEQIYVASIQDEIVGYGIMELGIIVKNVVSVGMFVNHKFRQRGIGTDIIRGLKDIAYNKGLNPIAGCWYYNHNSKKTLEKAGLYSKTRLIKVKF